MSAKYYSVSPRGGAGIEEKHLSKTTLKKISGIQATRRVGEESLCDWLWSQTGALRTEAFDTGFIQGIAKGNLDPNNYGGYTVQDAIYCAHATENLVIAAPKAGDEEVKGYLDGQETSLAEYTKYLFEIWHIKSKEGIALGKAAKEYSDYERKVAEKMDPLYYLIAMLPCYRLWPWLANEILKHVNPLPASNVYKFWVDENSGSTAWQKLQVVIDHHAQKIDKATAMEVFENCMKGEVAFFSSAVPK